MKNKILVSVIIPTYRRSEYLSRAIDSVLNQTYSNIEIFVVDDNNPESIDRFKTEKVMRKYSENIRVNYIKHEKNKNGSAARNTGIKNSKGKYIAFLDDDDYFLPEKIELQVKKLESLDDSWGLCYTGFIRKKENKIIDKGVEDTEGYIGDNVLKGELYISAGSNLMVRRDIVERINGFDEEFKRRQDLEFLIRASKYGKTTNVKKTCLVINKDDRSNALLTEEEIINNIELFFFSFKNFIEDLSVVDREKVIIGQYLLLARYYLTKLDIKSTYKVCKENNITLWIFIRNIFYLVKRKAFKQCYGFKI